MDLVSMIKAIFPVEPANLKTDTGTLAAGDRLIGKVLKLHSDGKVIMDFNSFKAVTEAPMEVKVGQSVHLEVVEVGNPIKMRILANNAPQSFTPLAGAPAGESSSSLANLVQQLASDLKVLENSFVGGKISVPVQNALQGLSTLFSGLDLTADSNRVAAEIQQKVENSGLFFEKKMVVLSETLSKHPTNTIQDGDRSVNTAAIRADFKPNAMVLLDFLNKLAPADTHVDEVVKQRLEHVLKEMLADLGHQHHLAKERLATEDPFQLFHLAVPLPEHKESAKIKLYYAKKSKKERQDQPMVSILLNLERLGPVRSDLVMLQRDLTITFYVGNSNIKDRFEQQIETIRTALTDLFDSVSLAVRVSEKKINAFDAPVSLEANEYKVDLHI